MRQERPIHASLAGWTNPPLMETITAIEGKSEHIHHERTNQTHPKEWILHLTADRSTRGVATDHRANNFDVEILTHHKAGPRFP
jgi:hypothetical protein